MMSAKEDKNELMWRRADEIQARDGRLTARAVVADAKDPDSPFHDEFNWDIGMAAEAHWEEVARTLIRVKLRKPDPVDAPVGVIRMKSVPAFVRDPDAPAEDQAYISLDRVRQDPDKAHRLLCAEFTRIAGLLTRVYALAEALNRVDDIEPLMDRFSVTRNLFEQSEAVQ